MDVDDPYPIIECAIKEAKGFKMSVTTYGEFDETTLDLYFTQERDAIMFELRYR